ncbi:MAG: hypothetical protein A3C43_02920 [Candidatus Schekmanbacteria bacterium RIFCSPHIGHO2_02_FULL_38_11]|uniref:Pyridoxamine 5'-phosphate oxidase putative domain-containing protein n=1 Tax=Candidatus Schekmanbacteria bacterium RIFCSPLOWO2_12_FULL_38_15 TaxID=1817883 RepID=A0A1F7SEL1_9BACT|nr:MAG: hypothetical protein A2043_10360 [Candidatus Schekmanbacteria bacterium GWA2_38_9]OGL49465.1 MAG: hypothetical protein A3H37_10180 [Candidatus Schekmanbacteria bacterium RIFCSPLOWO2_02_FULL_38_14]OGL52171.1 MAG: hypothetical protein A3G31_07070 [Candidatus Schekmanbacteria bacterium RIFCSPLOWO2_12_FULL_38_15]OGL53574.1 MAG: hypothetical protein A3C43_02920 [Candidatus Schekmanbacteria bacterium RIFCSPHIGHO2_02_FULL_38_11]
MAKQMTEKEIETLLNELYEGTLMLVDSDRPYGVVCWYCFNGKDIWLGLLPQGRKFECMKKNPNAAFTVFKATDDGWSSVFAEGRIEQVKDREGILIGMKLAAEKYKVPQEVLEAQVEKSAKTPDKSMTFRIKVEKLSGRKSY